MNKREIIAQGFVRGYNVAKNIKLVDIGDYCDRGVLQTGEWVKVTSDNWLEVHTNIASECESDSRQFFPFEFLAHDLNVLSDKKSYDVWAVFDESIFKGQMKALKERWKDISRSNY